MYAQFNAQIGNKYLIKCYSKIYFRDKVCPYWAYILGIHIHAQFNSQIGHK
jgi:hypothetical protein